jgi:hypothetical protein
MGIIYLNFIIGMGAGCVFFIACLKSYTIGLKHGKQIASKEVPTININPIEPIKEVLKDKAADKQEELINQAYQNIMNYTGDVEK